MALADYQRLLARLYTDPGLRARWRDDPDGLAAEFGLTPDESSALSQLSQRQVGQFAGALIRKRRNEVEKLLPLSLRTLGTTRFEALFGRHAAGFVPSGVPKHRDDALAFAAFLERTARAEAMAPAWAIDVIRFEAANLSASRMERAWSARWFRAHIDDLAALAPGGATAPPPRRPTLVIWHRLGKGRRLRRLIVAFPWSWRGW